MKGSIRQGFTLVELLIIVLAIAVLAAIFLPVTHHGHEKAPQNQCLSNQRQLVIGILAYANDHNETFPLPADWVKASGLSGDPEVFNCPTSKLAGTPANPDYGMNAYLYDTDPKTGKQIGLAIGEIDYPSLVEVTADLKGKTPPASGDAQRDALTNPFPDTYTVNGFFGPGSNGDTRHTKGAIIAFADGHVMLAKGTNLAGAEMYSLPIGPGRCAIDFAKIRSTKEAKERLQAFIAFNAAWPGTKGWSFNPRSHTLDLTGQLQTEGEGKSADPVYDTPLPGVGKVTQLMLDFTCTPGTRLSFGVPVDYGGPFPATEPKDELANLGCAFVIETKNHYIQGGSQQAFSDQSYQGYTPLAWVDLPQGAKGKRWPIKPNTTHFIVQAIINADGKDGVRWPTENGRTWQLTGDGQAGGMLQQQVDLKIVFPKEGAVIYSGPWIGKAYELQHYSRLLRVSGGTAKIKRIYYSATP